MTISRQWHFSLMWEWAGRPKSFDVAIRPTQTMPLPCFEFTIHYFFQDNQSALHLASAKGQSGVVKLLVESGAQLDIQNMVVILCNE